MKLLGLLLVGVLGFFVACSSVPSLDVVQVKGGGVPDCCRQIIVAQPQSMDSSETTLVMLERTSAGSPWHVVKPSWPARLGAKGCVWGLGKSPVPSGVKIKQEGDKRTPIGIFDVDSTVYAYDSSLSVGKGMFVHPVTTRDLWVEDATSPLYNQHILLTKDPSTSWEKSQQMKQNDHAHSIKVFVHHNSPKDKSWGRPVEGAGSSIFFHIWRQNGAKATAGCTAMPEAHLREMIKILDASKHPLYIIYPKTEYQKYQSKLNLP